MDTREQEAAESGLGLKADSGSRPGDRGGGLPAREEARSPVVVQRSERGTMPVNAHTTPRARSLAGHGDGRRCPALGGGGVGRRDEGIEFPGERHQFEAGEPER